MKFMPNFKFMHTHTYTHAINVWPDSQAKKDFVRFSVYVFVSMQRYSAKYYMNIAILLNSQNKIE